MPKDVNQYNLSRTIPNRIKVLIRQNSGFGCVICGRAVTHFDHVDPEWKDSRSHDPSKMTQLCGYCHDLKTRGIYTVDKIKKAMKNPKCFNNGFTFAPFELNGKLPDVKISGTTFKNIENLIKIGNNKILKFILPESKKEPVLLYADFYDSNGQQMFYIKNEKWFGNLNNWDIENKGKSIIIREKKNKISLHIENNPEINLITIYKLKMYYNGWLINGGLEGVKFTGPQGQKFTFHQGGTLNNCETAFDLSNGFSFGIAKPGDLNNSGHIKFTIDNF